MDKKLNNEEVIEVEVFDEIKYLEEVDKINSVISKKPLQIKGRISDLNKASDPNAKKVYDGLVEFNKIINDLHPDNNKRFFQRGPIAKFLGLNKLKNYVDKYQSYDGLISKINSKLDEGSRSLSNDNVTLRNVLNDLQKDFELIQADQIKLNEMERRILEKIENEENEKEAERIKAGIYVTLLQKKMDLEQKNAVLKQGALALSIMIKNNEELIESVKRAKDVTVSTLELTILTANSLEEQKQVLSVVKELNKNTSSLYLHVSETMKNQGTIIQKQASSAMLDTETLVKAYNVTIDALQEICNFRLEASGKLENSLKQLEAVSKAMDEKTKNILTNSVYTQLEDKSKDNAKV